MFVNLDQFLVVFLIYFLIGCFKLHCVLFFPLNYLLSVTTFFNNRFFYSLLAYSCSKLSSDIKTFLSIVVLD